MGTDIHAYVEVRQVVDGVVGEWEKVGDVFDYPYHDPDKPSDVWQCWIEYDAPIPVAVPAAQQAEDESAQTALAPMGILVAPTPTEQTGEWVTQDDPRSHGARGEPHSEENCYLHNRSKTDSPYKHRNYDLFAILADVRNGRGFAGVVTGEGFKTLPGAPRGIPDDLSPGMQAQWAKDADWTHDASWATLRELLDFPWDAEATVRYGVVSLEEYRKKRLDGEPYQAWSGSVWGGNVVTLDVDGALPGLPPLKDWPDDLLREWQPPEGTEVMVRDKWDVTYRQAVGEEWFAVLDRLKAFADPDDVRLIFYFDS